MGLSLFWATGQVLLASFPAFAKSSLAETNTLLIQGALACSGIGIALGSMVASAVSSKHIDLGLIPTGGIGVAIALVCLPNMNSLTAMGACLLLMGSAAGLLLVPLRTLIQYHAPAESLGTILAGSNWVQNIAMASFLFASMALSLAGLPPEYLLWLLAAVAVSGSIWAARLLPHSLTRLLVMTLLRSRYRVQVEGFEHLPPSGPVLLLGNHISWIDWAIVQIACPRPVRFVMIKYIYNHPLLKPILKFFKVIPIAPGDADQALAEVNRALANGEVVCIFPEGAISRNGHLGSFRRGYERAVEGVEGCIVPFYLHGLWGSRFSRASFFQQQGNIGKRDLVVGFGAPLPLSTQAPELKQKVAELSVDTWGKHIDAMHSLGSVYLRRAKQMLTRTLCVDTDGEQYTHRQVLSRVLALSQTLAKSQLADNAAVGIALPAGKACLVANLAVISRGYIAVNLNPATQGPPQQQSAKRADLALVITSADLVEQWSNVATCIAIDSLLDSASTAKRLSYALIARLVPAPLIAKIYFGNAGVDAPAAIQFDHEHSDSTDENPPTAAILSHRNLLASIKQTACVLDAQADDVLVACSPAWHRFGLTAHLLMPAIEGFPVVFTDTRDPLAIAKDAALQNATLLCLDVKQIDALVANERIHPLMLASCRFVLCNDESAKAEQIQAFKDKFTTEVYTSFGAAENAFAVCANIPDRLDTSAWKTQVGNKLGTVGLPLPGTSCRILNPEDLTPLSNGEVGEVVISGNQVMDGYLDQPERTAEKFILWQYRRWLRTGMRGQLDDDGFLTLVAV